MTDEKKLGVYLAQRRTDLGISQGALANAVGVSRPYITQIENSQRTPSEDVIQRLFAALGITIEQATQDLLADQLTEQQVAAVRYASRMNEWMERNLTPAQILEFSALATESEGFTASLSLAGTALPPAPDGWLDLSAEDRRLVQRLINRLRRASTTEEGTSNADQT